MLKSVEVMNESDSAYNVHLLFGDCPAWLLL